MDNPEGVLVVDKQAGPTSHDVVARLRKILGTRAVGHAGTLDPAATGVLVVAVGQATKLVPFLSAHSKQYEATVTFGRSTDTLDGEGQVTAEEPLPEELKRELLAAAPDHEGCGRLAGALDRERLRREQVPPAFSAIKLAGRPAYQRARKGETLALAPRPVEARIEIVGSREDTIVLGLTVSKGYYVRALARDLGEALGIPAHLSALRRIASGPFTLAEAVLLSAPPEQLASALQPLAACAGRVLPIARLTREGARQAAYGRRLTAADFEAHPPDGTCAWLAPSGKLAAIGTAAPGNEYVVDRGFAYDTSSSAS